MFALKSQEWFDQLRKKEYPQLDAQQQTYLDFTGSGLYAQSQLQKHFDLLQNNVFGNPHSVNPSSAFSTKLIEETRGSVLSFFNATNEYECIFTANASGALKILADCFPFDQETCFVLSKDNHNSVLGIKEKAFEKQSHVRFIALNKEMGLCEASIDECFQETQSFKKKLLAFPAQSNYSGVKHSLELLKTAKEKGFYVLLDAAAFAPTNPLDLQKVNADFVCLSFYKMFGYPTGLGCLLVKKSTARALKKCSFAGGTVQMASTLKNGYILHENHEAFEEGTVNFNQIPAIKYGLDHLKNIGMDQIQAQVSKITGIFLQSLDQLRHANGRRMISIIGTQDLAKRGGTISFNINDASGERIDLEVIEQKATDLGISLRTGCFCNPGADESYFDLKEEQLESMLLSIQNNKLAEIQKFKAQRGAVRISVSYMSNEQDLSMLLYFFEKFKSKELFPALQMFQKVA